VLASLGLEDAVGVLAEMVKVALLRPASSPGLASSRSLPEPASCAPHARTSRSHHLGPVLRVRCRPVPDWSVTTAVACVVLAVEERRLLEPLELVPKRPDRGCDLVCHSRVELVECAGVLELAHEPLVALEPPRDARLLRVTSAPPLVVPEAGLAHHPLELVPASRKAVGVKGNHGPSRAGP